MRKLIIALALLIIWALATVIPALPRDGQSVALTTLLSQGIEWGLVAAPVVLIVALLILRWDRLGLGRALKPADMLLAWPVLVLITIAIAVTLFVGLPPTTALIFIALNTAFVGFSEELMFRGFLFRGASETGRFWRAVILTTVLFGAVHLANVFITGDLKTVAIQAVTASCSGVILLALRLRTGSLYPVMIVHWLWDFSVTIVGMSLTANPERAGDAPMVVGVLLLSEPIISLVYGVFLLRKGRAACPEWKGFSTTDRASDLR